MPTSCINGKSANKAHGWLCQGVATGSVLFVPAAKFKGGRSALKSPRLTEQDDEAESDHHECSTGKALAD